MPEDLLAWQLRRAWRIALARHEADRAAGLETDSVRTVAGKILALLNDRPAHGPGATAEMALRATIAATILAEVEAMEAMKH